MSSGVKPIADAAQLEAELRQILPALQIKETEQTWNGINDAVERWKAVTDAGAGKFKDAYAGCLKRIAPFIQSAILSDRSKLSRSAVELIESAALILGADFEPFTDTFVPTVIKLSTRANKVFVTAALQCIKTIAERCPMSGQLDTFSDALRNKNRSMRICAAEAVAAMIEHTPAAQLQEHVDEIEAFVALAVEDADSAVRDLARSCFSLYSERFGSRLDLFQSKLSPKARKYLSLANSNQTSKRPSLKEIRAMALRNKKKHQSQEGLSADGIEATMDSADAYGAGALGKLNLAKPNFDASAPQLPSSTTVPQTPNALGMARRKARPSVLPEEDFAGLKAEPANTSAYGSRDVLDRSSSTIANALLHAQRVPKNTETAAAGKGPVRRMVVSGAQRIVVASKAEPKEKQPEASKPSATFPPVPVVEIPTTKSTLAMEPISSDPVAPTEAVRPSRPHSAASTAAERPRSAIPVLSSADTSMSSKITTRSNATAEATDSHVQQPKLTMASFKAPLWSSRLVAFEAFHRGLADPGAVEFDFSASKIAEILSLGLDDTHVKISNIAMHSLKIFVERHNADPRYLDMFLGRVLSLAKANSAPSGRSSANTAASDILDALKKAYDPEALISASLNVLSSSDWAKVSRVKLGALDVTAAVLAEHSAIAGRPHVMRSLVSKLAAFIPDVDSTSGRRLKSVLIGLESSYSPAFFSATCALKPNERKLLRSILLKDIPDWDSKEKQGWSRVQMEASQKSAAPSRDVSFVEQVDQRPKMREEAPAIAPSTLLSLPRSPIKTDTQETLVPVHEHQLVDRGASPKTSSTARISKQESYMGTISSDDVFNAPNHVVNRANVPEFAAVIGGVGPAEQSFMAIDRKFDAGNLSVMHGNDRNISFDLAAVEMPNRRTSMATTNFDEPHADMSQDLIAFDVSVVLPGGLFPLASSAKNLQTHDLDSSNLESKDVIVYSHSKQEPEVSADLLEDLQALSPKASRVETVELSLPRTDIPDPSPVAQDEHLQTETGDSEDLRPPPSPKMGSAVAERSAERTPVSLRTRVTTTPRFELDRMQHDIELIREQSRQEVALLEAEISESRRQFESQLLEIQASRDALISQHENALSALTAAAQATESVLRDDLTSSRQEVANLRVEIGVLEERIVQMREEHARELSRERNESHERIRIFMDKLETEQQAVQKDREQWESLEQAKLEELAELRALLESNTVDKGQMDGVAAAFEATVAELRSTIADRDERIASLRATVQEMGASVEASANAVEAAVSARDQDVAMVKAELAAAVAARENEVTALRLELEERDVALRQAADAATASKIDIDLRMQEYERTLASQTEQIQQLQEQIATHVAETGILRASAAADGAEQGVLVDAAVRDLREEHAAAVANLAAEHERHVQLLREDYQARIIALEAVNGSQTATERPAPETLQASLHEMEAMLAAKTAEHEHHVAQIAQLKSENEIKRVYLEQMEDRLLAERREFEAQAAQELAMANQRNDDLTHLLKESEAAYDSLHRMYNAEVHGMKDIEDSEEFLGAEEAPEQVASLEQAIELLTADDVSLPTLEYLLTVSHPADIQGDALATMSELAKRYDQDGLTLCKTLLLAQDSIAINPALVENNEESAIDLLAVGAAAVNDMASHLIPDLKLCLEKFVSTVAEAILPQRISYTAHYILSLELASTIPYVQTLFTRLVLLLKDTDGRRLAPRIASIILPALHASDIEMRKTAFESLGQLYSHLGPCLLRELSKEMGERDVPGSDLLRHSIKKRLGVTDEDMAVDN